MFELNIALQSLIGIIILLVLLFLFLLGYTFWTRQKKQYWNRYEQKFRSYFFSLLLDYAEQSEGHLEADEIIKKISKRSNDYSFFLQLLDELDSNLYGPERERLDNIIQQPVFESFHEKKLFEFSTNSKLYACEYFQKSKSINRKVLQKLKQISRSSNLKLSFAATKALQSVDNWKGRRNALLRFFKRSDTSELMIAELLHKFDSGLAEDRDNVGKMFEQLLLEDISSSIKNIIVRYMGHQQFFGHSDFLHELLESTNPNTKTKPLIRGLITALGELYHTESEPIIKLYCNNKYDIALQLSAVKTLSIFGGENNISFLLNLLPEASFEVRKAIIYEFVKDDQKLAQLTAFVNNLNTLVNKPDKAEMAEKRLLAPKSEILEIGEGLRIATKQRQAGVYV